MPSSTFSVSEALELGQFVLAAYDLYTMSDPSTFVPPGGCALVTPIYADDITDLVADYKVFGFIARSGSDAVVAIRGTEPNNLFEWFKDFLFVQIPFPYVDTGKTEQGFTGFYSTLRTGPHTTMPRVLDALRALVADGTVQTLRIAGHSLGAALATLLAIDLAGNGIITPTVYTFASPKVGNLTFASAYNGLIPVSWRIANSPDVAPKVPLLGYAHVNTEVPIDSTGKTRATPTCWHSMLTYLNTLGSTSVALAPDCKLG